jgi:heavy metal sensor kinase
VSRWPRSVRTRLALWHGLALLIVVSVYAAAVLAQVRDDLYEGLDGQLEGDHSLALQWLQRGVAPGGDSPIAPRDADLPDIPWVDAWSSTGQRVFSAGQLPELPPEEGPPSTWPRVAATVVLDRGAPVRTLVRPATVHGETVVLRVGRSERFVREELWEFATALGLSLPFAFAIAAGAGYVLARRALSPVSAMTERARRITAARLEERLPVEDPNDEFGRLAGVFNDALARLEQAFEMERRFTADASHELRTPLTAIRSVGEVGLREPRTEAEYREIIGSVLEEVERLTAMADSLLTLSRADAGKASLHPEPLDLVSVAREAAADLEVLAEEKQQRFQVDAADDVPVAADRTTLRQAVINLLDNAIKYSPERATIRLVARCTASEAVLEIVDAGPGIEAKHLPHVFDRFYRVESSRPRARSGGAGLGLSIARWAVEANGGRLEVESHVSRGSTFRIVLPAAYRRTTHPSEEKTT